MIKFCSLIIVFACLSCSTQPKQPDIILIFTDDQGYGDVAINGNQDLHTPRLDALAEASLRMDGFTVQPVCSPSRATLMTGRHFLKTGVWGVHGGRDYLNLDERTVAEALQERGYFTAMIGKWHLGKTAAYLPQNRGFDKVYRQTNLYAHENPIVDVGAEVIEPKGWTIDIFTDYAIDIMTSPKDQPYFLYLAYPQIHEPFFAPDSLIKKYQAEGHSESLARLYAMTEQLDQNVGRLLDVLKDSPRWDNTLVLFIGDNGPIGNPWNVPHLTKAEMARRNPKNFRGTKGNVFENGVRVPAFAYWPGKIAPGMNTARMDLIDIYPTLIQLAGETSLESAEPQLEGENLLPIWLGRTDTLKTRDLFYGNHETYWPDKTELYSFLQNKDELIFEQTDLAISRDQYKFVQIWNGSLRGLYDIHNDPSEQFDLSDSLPDLRHYLEGELKRWWQEEVVRKSKSYGMPQMQIGSAIGKDFLYACAPTAILGDVLPKSHSIHNWEKDGDGIVWQLEVLKEGNYYVTAELKVESPSGSLFIQIAGQELSKALEKTQKINLGQVYLKTGEQTLKVFLKNLEKTDKPIIKEFWGLEFAKVPGV